jgi:hypothetical protein
MVNYRELLIKYINHVGLASGEDKAFVWDEMPEEFNEEEVTMLKLLEIESRLLPEGR